MSYAIGFGIALGVSVFARVAGFDRERVFYPVCLVVIASYYVLFAAMGGPNALLVETLVMAGFVLASVAGFRRNLWIVVAALTAHGVFDFFHGGIVTNPGVPAWWPPFCLAYDVTAAGFLAFLSGRLPMKS